MFSSHVQQVVGLDDLHRAREAAVLQDLLRTSLRTEGGWIRPGSRCALHGHRRAVRKHRPPIVSCFSFKKSNCFCSLSLTIIYLKVFCSIKVCWQNKHNKLEITMKHSHIIDSKIIRVAFLLNLSLDTGMKFDFLGPATKKYKLVIWRLTSKMFNKI